MCLHDVEYCTYYRKASFRPTIIWCCKIVVIESLSKLMSFLQKNRIIDWNVVKNKASLYVPVFTHRRFSDEFWRALKICSLFFFQVAKVLPEIPNWFVTPLLRLPFSSSFNASHLTFKATSWSFLFVAIFVASATNNGIKRNLKISKHSNIMAFELKHLTLLQQNIKCWKS